LFRNQPIRNKNGLWWPCLLTDWDEMSILYRGPFIDASYQVSVHLAKWLQMRRFLKISQSETRMACSDSCFRIRIPIPRFIINVKIMILNQANQESSMIQNLTRNVYLMSIFSLTTSRYQRHIFVLVPECGEYEICNQKIFLRSISRQRPFFIELFRL
jgi:hypothetical protein